MLWLRYAVLKSFTEIFLNNFRPDLIKKTAGKLSLKIPPSFSIPQNILSFLIALEELLKSETLAEKI